MKCKCIVQTFKNSPLSSEHVQLLEYTRVLLTDKVRLKISFEFKIEEQIPLFSSGMQKVWLKVQTRYVCYSIRCCITKSLRDNNIQGIPQGAIRFVLHGPPNLESVNILGKSHTCVVGYYMHCNMEPLKVASTALRYIDPISGAFLSWHFAEWSVRMHHLESA